MSNVAQTILQQMGNNKFRAMTGAKNFVGSENSLSFTFPSRTKINACHITLTPLDLYKVEFIQIRRKQGIPTRTIISTFNDIYADQLQNLFTENTGLYTHL